MSSIFDLWLKGCEINHTELYCLEGGAGESGLYKTQSKYLCKNYYYNTTPVYHVWINGKSIAETTNYMDAVATWDNHKSEVRESE